MFNSILIQGTMPQTWCGGVITPICYKSAGRSDPVNYRGICLSSQSSCLGKLFSSIFLNILHKSQIGFLPNNRTADHVFTLRTLIDKYQNLQLECSTSREAWHQKTDFALIELKSGRTITRETITLWYSKNLINNLFENRLIN